jgi:thiol-disulfide isomerase/thioredoxin
MRGLVKRNGGRGGVAGQRAMDKPPNLKTVHTLEEYKKAMDEEHGKIVVVRFFATWCKACKAIQPAYYRMASMYPHIAFLEVPVTNQNANLHQGLEVPSLPYGHIYYPEAGLVEELKISRKYFPDLVKNVRWYDEGRCDLDDFELVQADGEKQ